MKRQLVIFGTKQIADVISFYFKHDSNYEIVAYSVDGSHMQESSFLSCPVVPFEELADNFPPDSNHLFIAVSYQQMNALRAAKYSEGEKAGYSFARYVSSKATVWPGTKIGDNSFVMEDNTLQPFTSIGNNTILWSGNHIGHHSIIGNHCFVASHVVVSGNVTIEDFCFVGVNATLRDGIRLGEASLIGAGALVLDDTDSETVIAAEPSKKRRITSRKLKKV